MPAYKAAAIAGTPLGRLVTEEEIARMVTLVCSPEFDFVTGRAIVMDGGRTLPRFPRIGISGAERLKRSIFGRSASTISTYLLVRNGPRDSCLWRHRICVILSARFVRR